MSLSIRESLSVSISDFRSRKLRSIVTMLSIVLSTLTVVIVQAMVTGVKESTLAWMMERGGMTRIDIYRNWRYPNPNNLPSHLTLNEFNQLRRSIPEAKSISPQIMSHGRMSKTDKMFVGSVGGVLPDFTEVEGWDVAEGRFISHFDNKTGTDVIVIGSTVRKELFGNINPLRRFITFQGRRFQVIGVMEERIYSPQGGSIRHNLLEYLNRRAYLPLSTIVNKLPVENRIESLSISAASIEEVPELREKAERTLLSLRQNEPVFSVVSALEQAEQPQVAAKVFGIILFIISIVSLLVAGIVILNIMTASIKERTREIGIRMAVGARRLDIFFQFLIQTVFFTFVGGTAGIIVGLAFLGRFSEYIGIELSAGIPLVIISLAVALSVGMIFGIFPAVKASNLDPVKCLAYE